MKLVSIIQYGRSMVKGKIPIASPRDEAGVDMNDWLEDTIRDIGEDYFRRAHVYDTLYSDKEESLYPRCTYFTLL